jgi:hypothetical protein
VSIIPPVTQATTQKYAVRMKYSGVWSHRKRVERGTWIWYTLRHTHSIPFKHVLNTYYIHLAAQKMSAATKKPTSALDLYSRCANIAFSVSYSIHRRQAE